jgi:2-polyprenyl-3-methyl-5-hydroxy-6-metoxy-1,4-benzoquinol methylase
VDNLHNQYKFRDAGPTWASQYLWKHVVATMRREVREGARVFEVGCGNGAAAEMLAGLGYDVTGVDPSESGIRIATANPGKAKLAVGNAYDDLAGQYGQFAAVVSLEVVEHCFWPRKFASTVFELLQPGGIAIISTPYHGYAKNLALALLNKFDAHWGPLWDGGHIKFWSEKTLGALLTEAGFTPVTFIRAGRIPPLAKSMIAVVRKPAAAPR